MSSALLKTPGHDVPILIVHGRRDQVNQLDGFLHEFGWESMHARNIAEAAALLTRHVFQVVIASADDPVSGWREVLAEMQCREHPALLVVTSRLADERLWAEALNYGAFDLLAQPFDRLEVSRVIGSAFSRFVCRPAPATAKPRAA